MACLMLKPALTNRVVLIPLMRRRQSLSALKSYGVMGHTMTSRTPCSTFEHLSLVLPKPFFMTLIPYSSSPSPHKLWNAQLYFVPLTDAQPPTLFSFGLCGLILLFPFLYLI